MHVSKLIFISLLLQCSSLLAQTENDGIFMAKGNLCSQADFMHISWNHYWEGSLLRTNENIGTVKSNMAAVMANYGISDRLNVMFGLPWMSNKATAGTLHPMKGIQDLSLFAKYRIWSMEKGKNFYAVSGVAGVSSPVSSYTPDLLPLSIGLHSRTASLRFLADAARNNFFVTASAAFMRRGQVKLDRESYYTTELINSNMVSMPDVWNNNIRLGYRKDFLLVEAYLDQMNTLGGFDIRRNDMPFVSNEMDATRIGLHARIPVPRLNGLGLVLNGMQTLAGRNMGKSSMYGLGVFYVADLNKKVEKK